MKIKSLNEVISFNNNFKTAINLYLSLNKTEKILNYIPTKSSVHFMNEYLEAIIRKNEHATLLVGPYGKGKSHLLLVLMAILSLDRNSLNFKITNCLKYFTPSIASFRYSLPVSRTTSFKSSKRDGSSVVGNTFTSPRIPWVEVMTPTCKYSFCCIVFSLAFMLITKRKRR